MLNITCLDSDGNTVTHFTQWDTDQSLRIVGLGLTTAPFVHFCNENSKEAIVVESKISERGIINVSIPNILLQEGKAITAYIYAYTSDTAGRTLETIKIPVRPRPQPQGYTYVENIKYTSIVSLADIFVSIDRDFNVICNTTYDEILKAYNDKKMFRINFKRDIYNGWTVCSAVKLDSLEGFEFCLNRSSENILVTCHSNNVWSAQYAEKIATEKYVNDLVSPVETKANEAYNLALGAGRAIVFEDYQKFCEYILETGEEFGQVYPIGTTILIGKPGVPDLWYYGESTEYKEYIPTDEVIMENLANLGWFEIGYYRFAQSENQNVDLEGYVSIGEFEIHAQGENLHTTTEEKQNWNKKLDKSNENGGFVAGNYKDEYGKNTSGVIIGKNAQGQQQDTISPVVIGENSASDDGVAIGYNASSLNNGTSIGANAKGAGVSIGHNAKTIGDVDVVVNGEVVDVIKDYPINAIQLGEGTNNEEGSFQVYEYKLLDKDGNIPKERLKNACQIKVLDNHNLNAVIDTGIYICNDDTSNSILFVVSHDTIAKQQILFDGNDIKTRNYISNYNWTKWTDIGFSDEDAEALLKMFATKEDVSNKINDIIHYDMVTAKEEYPTAAAVVNYVDNALMHNMSQVFEAFATKEEMSNKESISNKINDLSDFSEELSPEEAYPSVAAMSKMAEELGTYIELNRNHTYTYDTFESFMEELENLDGYLASYGKPGEVIVIKENDFPNLMITNNEVSQGENGNLDKVYALELIKTQGYFEAWGLHFSPLFEEYFTKLEKTENKTLGGNMPVTHPDCTIATDESYPSLKYLKESLEYFKEKIEIESGYTEIIDNLLSTNTDAALSANQGRVLNEKIGDIESALDELHNYAQNLIGGGN